MIFGGTTHSCLLWWWRWKCTQQQQWPQSLLFGSCSGHPHYHMFTDHVLSPVQMDAACFCANTLNLWSLSSGQMLCPDLIVAVGLSPATELRLFLHALVTALSVWRGAHGPGTSGQTPIPPCSEANVGLSQESL